ncbi:MAG TPA: hypothetical protein VK934_11815 [Fimbriimonas sp.]|nr:hypothetical protein [Fimbriimonas sp.]
MKVNQNDLIVSIVAVVLGLGFSAAFFFLQRKPISVAAPQSVVTSAPELPTGSVTMANALPGASAAAGGGGGFGGPSGPAGFSSGPSGPSMGMSGGPGASGGKNRPGAATPGAG